MGDWGVAFSRLEVGMTLIWEVSAENGFAFLVAGMI